MRTIEANATKVDLPISIKLLCTFGSLRYQPNYSRPCNGPPGSSYDLYEFIGRFGSFKAPPYEYRGSPQATGEKNSFSPQLPKLQRQNLTPMPKLALVMVSIQ